MDDQFRPIEGFPGYRVNRDGEVQSCRSPASYRSPTETWLPLRPIRRGRYLTVNLSDGSKKFAHYIHRLVLEAFVGPRPPGLVCCHCDGDSTNNHLDNLRWDTYQANEADKLIHGTRRVGSEARSKLHENEVLEIRRLRGEGVKIAELAAAFGVSPQNIEAIVHRRSWRHLP